MNCIKQMMLFLVCIHIVIFTYSHSDSDSDSHTHVYRDFLENGNGGVKFIISVPGECDSFLQYLR